MVDFIKDVRAEFDQPAMPFIIGGPGMDGYESRGKQVICNSQRRAADRPEINETVAYIETRTFAARYACLDMDDAACLGLSDAGCDGRDNIGCACADIIEGLKANQSGGSCNSKVNPDQEHHWSWNARSLVALTTTLTPIPTLTLTP